MYIDFERLNKRRTESLLSDLDKNKISDKRDVKKLRLASQESAFEGCQCMVQSILFTDLCTFSLSSSRLGDFH